MWLQVRKKVFRLSAASQGHPGIVQLFLDHGADANAKNVARSTQLHLAACRGHLQVVEVLMGRGADPCARGILVKRDPFPSGIEVEQPSGFRAICVNYI